MDSSHPPWPFSSRLSLRCKHLEPSPPVQPPPASRRRIPNLGPPSPSLPPEQAPQAPLRRIPVSRSTGAGSHRSIPIFVAAPSPSPSLSLPPAQAPQAPLRRTVTIPLSPTASTFPSLESLPPGQIHNISVSRSTTPLPSATTGGEGQRGVGASHSEKNNEESDYETEEDDHYSEEDDHYSEEDDYFSADDVDDEKTWIILRGPGLSGDESFDKCCIFGNEVELTYNQRNQLCSIVEELPMPEMKHYVCTLMNSNVIPGEGKMIEMDQVNCQFCHQPMANCKYSNRRATSFKIIMQEDYDHFAEQLNKYSDKWLHALAAGHRLEFYLEKSTNSTTMCGPWWSFFLMSHLVDVNDVVTFKLPTEDDIEDEIADEDAEVMEYEEEAGDGIFEVTVADPDGNKKPFHLMNGPIYVPEEIRGTLYKTVFSDMHTIGEADMNEIVWEMYKDASYDVDSIDELQYIVHKVDAIDATSKRLALPENIDHGYNYPKRGIARFSSRRMNEDIAGHYFIQTGVLGRLVIWLNEEDMDNFCEANSIVNGSLLLIRVDMMQDYIGVSVHKIEDI
ncbi:hypothetical protein ACQ4PT_015701 [Festuca glaucescens]